MEEENLTVSIHFGVRCDAGFDLFEPCSTSPSASA